MSNNTVDLSIIIVSYNAVEFLTLTLDSVKKAIEPINAEVLLIDNSNNSKLKQTVTSNYPFVKLHNNSDNLGFAKANNMGLKIAKGKLAILLNPDTIVPEDIFTEVISYYDYHPITGGLGVKMIDGRGHYLKESKRGFPNLSTSFYKFVGAHILFPKSPLFAKYYEGHLNDNKVQKVDVLSGAFLVIPRNIDGTLTLLDEQYFMYGEDIDLSYRLQKKHCENVYFPNCPIIHFKGQSTTTNPHIIWHFYNAMWLFYKDHIGSRKPLWFNFFIKLLIKLFTQIILLKNKLIKTKNSSKTPIKSNSIQFVSSNNGLALTLEKTFGSKVQLVTHPTASTNKSLTIFDFNFISYKNAIQHLLHTSGQYGFLCQNQKALIITPDSGTKGQVIHL